MLLWVVTVALRMLLAREVAGRFLAAPWFDAAFLIDVVAIVGAEIVILRQVSKAYETTIIPISGFYDLPADNRKPLRSITKKLLIGSFVLSLPLGLWDSRSAPIALGGIGILVGSAFNLFVIASLTHVEFIARSRVRQTATKL